MIWELKVKYKKIRTKIISMADQKKGNLTTAESKTEQFKIHPHRMCVYTVPRLPTKRLEQAGKPLQHLKR